MKMLRAAALGLGICGLVEGAEIKLEHPDLKEYQSYADSSLLNIRAGDRFDSGLQDRSRLFLELGEHKRYVGFRGNSRHVYYEVRLSGRIEFDPVERRLYYDTAKIDLKLKLEIRK